METIQQQMAEAKKNERANALKEVKRLCKEFGFTAGMLKGSLTGQFGHKFMSGKEDLVSLEAFLMSLREKAREVNTEEAGEVKAFSEQGYKVWRARVTGVTAKQAGDAHNGKVEAEEAAVA